MVDECKIEEYYSALEVAELRGITKQAVIDGCKKGKIRGAVKSQPDRTNKQGLWLIPKETIDNPNTEFVPALVQPNTDIVTLKNNFKEIIAEESSKQLIEIQKIYLTAIEPLHQKIEEQNQKLIDQASKIDQLQKQNEQFSKSLQVRIGGIQTNIETIKNQTTPSEPKKGFWKWLWGD